ncbi:MAG: type II toxin-antitoxin system RelE/ParE family toxin [Chloroflexi bacterium]|nr:type II toxin-antitoxin system RelE/ParE family toxin [Chloroflexota bacterium]
MYTLETTPQFDADIRALDSSVARRILKKLKWLAENPQSLRFGLKHMPGDLRGLQKYRVGDYRIFFWVRHDAQKIILYGIEHRRRAYKRLK